MERVLLDHRLQLFERLGEALQLVEDARAQEARADLVGFERERLVAVAQRVLPLLARHVVVADGGRANRRGVALELLEDVAGRTRIVPLADRELLDREGLGAGDVPHFGGERDGSVRFVLGVGRADRHRNADLRGELTRRDAGELVHVQVEAVGLVLDVVLLHRDVRRERAHQLAKLLGGVLAEVVVGVARAA